ncbi:MAG: hypothetical protein KKA51_07180 [Nanoarchaeota archaeon]|nr:hypothetical protein [Nanoarchaeota archaeon]MBU1270491.1 hypothetical protein [Nanoarchaeota archaeon]MBU2442720.1 hypothetical protein [Nanoarchaeota archaeon]
MEEGKSGENESKLVLRKSTLRDINYLLSKSWVTEQEVYNLVKNFLKGYLNINYEFTKDELFEELKNVYLPYTIRADFFKFIDLVFMFEYSNVKYSDKELKILIEEFKNYLDYLIVPNFVEKSMTGTFFFKSIRGKLTNYLKSILKSQGRKEKSVLKDTKKQESKPTNLSVLDPVYESHIDINTLLEKIYSSINNGDFDSAKILYKQAMDKYQLLSPDEKAKYYENLSSVYNSLTATITND